jgi:hypothetical protein
MASRKTYLYGLGTGLIAGAIILQLAGIGDSAEQTPQPDPASVENITDEQLRLAAKAHGYVLMDADSEWVSKEEMASKVAEAEERLRAEAGTSEGAPSSSTKVYAFTIATGSDMTTIANLLYELGLISDYNGFLQEMEERGLAGKIQAKHYRFDEVPTIDILINALITP